MTDFVSLFGELIDKSWLTEHIIKLYNLERKQTFPAYQAAASYVHELMKKEGFKSELINFPADGKTVYQDKCSPIGWDVSSMSLTLLSKVPGITDPVIADFEKEPLSVVKHSVSTPPEGLVVPIITETQMLSGEDVTGAMILLEQSTPPRKDVIRMLLDLGAIGWVSDFLEDPHTTPDSVSWANGSTEYNNWHVQAEDREFIAFQISPRVGYSLRKACQHGVVRAKIFSNGHRYVTNIPVITACLPGESTKELWLVSHMYEPLIDDNANGVIGSIAILKALKTLSETGKIRLKYSVRVVFGAEMYGTAAYAEYRGGDLSDITIGAINTDGVTSSLDKSKNKSYALKEAADQPGFAGNLILHYVAQEFLKKFPEFSIINFDNYYGDDCFISDASVACPCVWIEYFLKGGYHHNSWLDASVYDADATVNHLIFISLWVRAMVAMDEAEVKNLLPFAVDSAKKALDIAATQTVRQGTKEEARMDFLLKREIAKIRGLSLWGSINDIESALQGLSAPESAVLQEKTEQNFYEYTENFVFSRITRGFPHDLARVPFYKRKALPGGILYNKVADIISRMDGKKSFKTLIDEVEWDTGLIFSDATIKSYLRVCILLANNGYFAVTVQNPIGEDQIIKALVDLGVKKGETLLVHSSLSGLGYLPGGAETLLSALRKTVGKAGTLLAPAFTKPYVSFKGKLNKSYQYRPYDRQKNGKLRDKSIYTGALPNRMLKEPDACRSGHISHEWVAVGKEAEACTQGHGFTNAPADITSPMTKALENKGSVVFIGCGLNANTFVHYLETLADVPCLQEAVVSYIDEEGTLKWDCIKKHLPGHRNFYRGADNHFYEEALRRGLHIHQETLGIATLYRIELAELYSIGMEILKEDPNATLCSSPGCPFCSQFRK